MKTAETTGIRTTQKENIRIIGIEVKTVNAPGKAEKDIPALWGRFMAEQISTKVPSKLSEEIYCVYCDYEGDHLAPYTILIGFPVLSNTEAPEGMRALDIPASNYAIFNAEGDLTGDAVISAWHNIWQTDLNRTYMADFEVYGKDAMDPKNGKIAIFIGINE